MLDGEEGSTRTRNAGEPASLSDYIQNGRAWFGMYK